MNKNNLVGLIVFAISLTSALVFSSFTTFQTIKTADSRYIALVKYLEKLEARQEKIYDLLIRGEK